MQEERKAIGLHVCVVQRLLLKRWRGRAYVRHEQDAVGSTLIVSRANWRQTRKQRPLVSDVPLVCFWKREARAGVHAAKVQDPAVAPSPPALRARCGLGRGRP